SDPRCFSATGRPKAPVRRRPLTAPAAGPAKPDRNGGRTRRRIPRPWRGSPDGWSRLRPGPRPSPRPCVHPAATCGSQRLFSSGLLSSESWSTGGLRGGVENATRLGREQAEAGMAEASLSATEAALENQRIGALQIRVAGLCTLVQICDGYDVNAIGIAVPSLTHAWNLPGPAFTTAFLWSSIGIMVGALSAGPIGDRFGRKPLLIGSLLIFGLASLFRAFAGSLGFMTIMRFLTGLGIGG